MFFFFKFRGVSLPPSPPPGSRTLTTFFGLRILFEPVVERMLTTRFGLRTMVAEEE